MSDHNFIKRIAPMLILNVLKAHSDEDNGLQLSEVVKFLQEDYGITMERKAVSRTLNDLYELSEIPYNSTNWRLPVHFGIKCDSRERSTGDIRSNWRISSVMEDAEVRLLTDALLAVRNYTSEHLLIKLQELGSKTLKENSQYIRTLSNKKIGNKQLMINIDALIQAIIGGKQVRFEYCDHGPDKQLIPQLGPDGKPQLYTVSPYQMVFRDGYYYLICGCENSQEVMNYRLGRIRNVEILPDSVRTYSEVSGNKNRPFNLRNYVDEHIHMYSGPSVTASFRIPNEMIGDVIDTFGENVDLTRVSDKESVVQAVVNRNAMIRFAKSFAPTVRVTAPADLVEDVKNAILDSLKTYMV